MTPTVGRRQQRRSDAMVVPVRPYEQAPHHQQGGDSRVHSSKQPSTAAARPWKLGRAGSVPSSMQVRKPTNTPSPQEKVGGVASSFNHAYKPYVPPGAEIRTPVGDPNASSESKGRILLTRPLHHHDALVVAAVDALEIASPSPTTSPSPPRKKTSNVDARNNKNECCLLPSMLLNERKPEPSDYPGPENKATWMGEFEEQLRKATADRRISQALIGLRAAREREVCLEREPRTRGAVGLALFSPLDDRAFEPIKKPEPPKPCVPLFAFSPRGAQDEVEPEDVEPEEFPVELLSEPSYDLAACPRLLTATMMQQLVDEALPYTVKTMGWHRVFAIGRDGDAFYTMLQNCAPYKHTVIVAQTSNGDILGGYATEPWQRQDGYCQARSFYGSGQSFLFSNHPSVAPPKRDDDKDDDRELTIFTWSGKNTYCQVCGVDEGQLAMGGGGAFGLVIEDDFSCGTTDHCGTFENPPLVPGGGRFDITNFEVYGFEPLSYSLSPPVSPNMSSQSVLSENASHSERSGSERSDLQFGSSVERPRSVSMSI